MKRSQFISALAVTGLSAAMNSAHAKTERVGGPCEGCEAIYEFGSRRLTPTAILPDYISGNGPKMEISGTIFHHNGSTPAAGVILYIYHTDQGGIYTANADEKGWGRRHGSLRAWIKTDERGAYQFLTLKPAPYPGRNTPAHIHATVKEPGINAYWIDEYMFEDDPLLTRDERAKQSNRCGQGISRIETREDGTLLVKRDIVLGLNIPGY